MIVDYIRLNKRIPSRGCQLFSDSSVACITKQVNQQCLTVHNYHDVSKFNTILDCNCLIRNKLSNPIGLSK